MQQQQNINFFAKNTNHSQRSINHSHLTQHIDLSSLSLQSLALLYKIMKFPIPPSQVILCLLTLITLLLTPTTPQPLQDLIDLKAIPMFPQNYDHKIYAGFLNITNYGKSLYYFFYESQSNPQNDPVVLWMNGGPGCSSMIGMVTQHGPFLFKPGTTQMYLNPYSWNLRANVIYLQAPAGVGFSYASQAYIHTNDTQTAVDNLAGLQKFFQKFPIYEGNDFYLAGQSYAGVYVPMLAKEIVEFNTGSQDMKINLRGFLLGNPCTHPLECLTSTYYSRFFTQILYTHGFLQQDVYNQYQGQCIISQKSASCVKLQKYIKEQVFLPQGANIYNLYGQCFYPKYPGEWEKLAGEEAMGRFEDKLKNNLKHPLRCSDALGSLTLFNANEFREALNVGQLNDTLPWTPCSDTLQYDIDQGAVFNILPMLVKQGLKIIYYSGDQDAIVPLQGTKYWFQQYRNQFGAAVKKSWRPWVTANQTVSGMLWQLQGLTLATVIGAGHMVPTDKPAEALEIFDVFLGYKDWKIPDYYEE